MIDLKNVYQVLKQNGVEFISGVPDTLLNDFCLGLDTSWDKNRHVLAANEGNAIALAAGYHLATNTVPLVYMQNSGMGNAMNPLISLTDKCVYSIPLVMMIGWRGEPGSGDWPQHQRQGELSPVLLDALNIPFKVLDEDEETVSDAIEWAVSRARELNQPTALLVRKNVLARKEKAGFDADEQQYAMSREDAIRELLKNAPDNAIFIASTGRITRELHAIRESLDQPHNCDFLNVGAMGHTLSIASGIAAAKPERLVICLDGDAAVLMHMGSMPVTAHLELPNLLQVILNNGAHESVGGQNSVGYAADLTAIGKGAGYQTASSFVAGREELKNTFLQLTSSLGPAFLEVRVRKGMRSDMPVLRVDTNDEKNRFIKDMTC
ncbi:phosphonopyruvate decarboxylase [Halomonas sp. HL-93]|uniref:phosphonopyruvate decarboxylase n=1 Tax=Halomonas sp. HL-93 TaxID=1666906 RepID=UPI0007F15471|nr:phosphonopyruvate decarboxylase [Halomonas sp. HL-93]SBR46116.1 phosphonopyruvate decarboxylase [Halomonas sp. HL-93]